MLYNFMETRRASADLDAGNDYAAADCIPSTYEAQVYATGDRSTDFLSTGSLLALMQSGKGELQKQAMEAPGYPPETLKQAPLSKSPKAPLYPVAPELTCPQYHSGEQP